MKGLPTSVRVGPYDIRIEEMDAYQSSLYEGAVGQYADVISLIHINTDVRLGPHYILDTLIHEINHVVFKVYGIEDEDNEERTVQQMATAWVQIYRDNPMLLSFIKSTCKPT